MKVTRFDARADLVLVAARLWGPLGDKWLTLALDTAATEVHLDPEVLDDLGYSPRDGGRITIVRSAIGSEQGYMTRVVRFSALGFVATDLAVHVHDLPDGFGIDGLLGLTYLKRFNLELRFAEGRILAERTGAD